MPAAAAVAAECGGADGGGGDKGGGGGVGVCVGVVEWALAVLRAWAVAVSSAMMMIGLSCGCCSTDCCTFAA